MLQKLTARSMFPLCFIAPKHPRNPTTAMIRPTTISITDTGTVLLSTISFQFLPSTRTTIPTTNRTRPRTCERHDVNLSYSTCIVIAREVIIPIIYIKWGYRYAIDQKLWHIIVHNWLRITYQYTALTHTMPLKTNIRVFIRPVPTPIFVS